MSIDPQTLAQVLKTPDTEDVTQSSIVTGTILSDPQNAKDLAKALDADDPLQVHNARRILCEFGPSAVPWMFNDVAASVNARRQLVQVLWAVLITESPDTIRQSLTGVKPKLNMLLDDRTDLPDTWPDYIEQDFNGRLCDLAYIAIQALLAPAFDQSLFQSLDEAGRDGQIATLKRSDLSDAVS